MTEQTETPEPKSELQSGLDDVSTALTHFSAVEAGLAELRSKYEKVIFPVDTAEGLKDARAARLAIRAPRYEVESIRKEAKAPILELGRRLDARAKQITEALLALEEPIDRAIKEEENRAERERQAKAEAEAKRIETIQQRINEIRAAAQTVAGTATPAQVMEAINRAEGLVVDESFAEFRQQAADAKLAVLATLRQLHAAAVEREAELARIKAEREELARLRAEQERRDAEDRARREAEERAARAAREEEERKARAAREEEERKQREALEEQRRQQAAEQERIDAENRRIAEERAAFEREQEAARKKREAEERKRRAEQEAERKRQAEAERERAAAEEAERARKARAAAEARKAKYPGEVAIVAALVAQFDVSEQVAKAWIAALKAGNVEAAA